MKFYQQSDGEWVQPRPRQHKHSWSEPYRNIFEGPTRVCENGPCGAIRLATGRIIVMRDGTKIIGSSK